MRRLGLSHVVLASVFAALSVTLVIFSIITQSWYLVDTTEITGDAVISETFETSERFGLSQREIYAKSTDRSNFVMEDTITHGYGSRDDEGIPLPDYEQVARMVLYLIIAGTVICSLCLAFTIAYGREKDDGLERGWRYIPVIIGSIGFVLIATATAYFIIAFPATVTDQGSDIEGFSQRSSVGFSYILAVAAAISILISVFLMYRTVNSDRPSPTGSSLEVDAPL